MIPVASRHKGGTVAIVASDRPRYFELVDALTGTKVPAGTHYNRITNYNVATGRNQALAQAKGDWIWFIDDDHMWGPDTLLKLLDHDVDVVGPLVARRFPPFKPQVFSHFATENFDDCVLHTWSTLQMHLDMGTTLLDVAAMGTPGLLVRRHVWEALLPYPFEWPHKDSNKAGEDTWFTYKAAEAGFRVCVDLTLPFPHLTTLSVYAYVKDGELAVYGGMADAEMVLHKPKRVVVPA